MAAAVAVNGLQDRPLGCSGSSRNENPVIDLPPVPLKTVPNGQSWVIQQGNSVVYIAKVKGSPYEMGYAYGQLYGAEIAKNIDNFVEYGTQKVEDLIGQLGIPKAIIDMIIG